MKNILTEKIVIPRATQGDLEEIFKNAECLLMKDKRNPLRTVLLNLTASAATLLISFTHDTSA